jgi:hypothetical protein
VVVTRRNFCGFSRLGVGVVDVDVYSASGKGPAIIFSKKAVKNPKEMIRAPQLK